MSQRTLRAGASAFAHLIPGFRAAKGEDETDPKTGKKARRAGDDKPDKDDDDKDARRAEEPDDAPGDDDEGVDGDDKPDLGDVEDPDDSLDEDAAPEEDDSDPKVRKAAKSGRKAERSRWATVMGHKATAGRVAAACQLLSTTTASAKSVIGTLGALPAAEAPVASGGRSRLDDRMAARAAPSVGQDAPSGAGNYGAQVAAALKKVRG